MSTITFADMYGARSGSQPTTGETANGAAATDNSPAPAFSWLGMIAALIIIRLLWEKAGK